MFAKKSKPNLTPDKSPMAFGSSAYTPTLRDFAQKRIRGEGAGFGDDFVNKMTNPTTASREARFQNDEVPFINNQFSSRGLARSAGGGMVTDTLNKANQSKNRDIDEMMAKFDYLNRVQTKQDISEGVRVGQQQQGAEFAQSNEEAAASRNLRDATVGQQNLKNQQNMDTANSIGNAALGVLGGPAGQAMSIGNAFKSSQGGGTNSFGVPGVTGAISPVKSLTIDDIDSSTMSGMNIQELLALLEY